MKKDLTQYLHNLNFEKDDFLFTKEMFTGFKRKKTLEDLIIRKSERGINYGLDDNLPFEINLTYNSVEIYAYKSTYIQLGIVLLELLFSKKNYIEIELTRTQSDIKKVFFYLENKEHIGALLEVDIKETYKSFEFFPEPIFKFPFSINNNFPIENTPSFYFTWSEKDYNKHNVENADQLIIELKNVESLSKLAELFLNIGNKNNELDEICLEHPIHGFGGVGYSSLEARFWLPNSLGFYCGSLDDIKF